MIIIPQLNDSPSDVRQLERFLSQTTGREFSAMSGTCYFPKIIKHWNDFKKITGLTDDMISLFSKANITDYNLDRGHKTNLKIMSDKTTSGIIMCIIFYARKHNLELVRLLYYFLAIRFYSNVVHNYFEKFCKAENWDTALTQLSHKHLFKIKRSISSSVMYLAEIEMQKQLTRLSNDRLTTAELIDIVYYLRSRINQSMRSFANKYYEIDKSPTSTIGSTTGEEEVANIALISEQLSVSICTYGQINQNALNKAISLSNINREIASILVKDLSVVNNRAKFKFILVLMSRVTSYTEWCHEPKRLLLVRRILQDTARIQNYSVKTEMLDLVKGFDDYYRIMTINENVILSFMAQYISLYYRSKYCS